MKIGLLVMGPEEEPKDVNKISYTHTADCDCAEAGKVLTKLRAPTVNDGVSLRARIDNEERGYW